MGIFDYYCSIDDKNCLLKNSGGQQYTSGPVFLVDKNFTKKIECDYSGYGYCNHSGNNIDIYDLGMKEYFKDWNVTKDDKSALFACPKCSKKIKNKVNNLEDFFSKESQQEQITKKIKERKNKLDEIIKRRDNLTKQIRIQKKEIKKMEAEMLKL